MIVFGDMIADMLSNKKLNPIVTELFMRGRKIDISLFYQTTLFYYTKKYKAKFYKLFYFGVIKN